MSNADESDLSTIPSQEQGLDEVEGHGIKEVAVGLGVAAAVIGSAGAANAQKAEPGPAERTTSGITKTVHKEMQGSSLKTVRTLGNQLSDGTTAVNNVAAAGDTLVAGAEKQATTTKTFADTTVAQKQQQVRDAAASAQETVGQKQAEVGAEVESTRKSAEAIAVEKARTSGSWRRASRATCSRSAPPRWRTSACWRRPPPTQPRASSTPSATR